jgi:threonine dehydratase
MKVGEPVVTHSSGNHAQAIAFAAAATGRRATIVMPTNAPLPKRHATESYGAAVQLCAPADRAAAADACAAALQAKLVHPSEDPDVIAGQGERDCVRLRTQLSTLPLPAVHGVPLDFFIKKNFA